MSGPCCGACPHEGPLTAPVGGGSLPSAALVALGRHARARTTRWARIAAAAVALGAPAAASASPPPATGAWLAAHPLRFNVYPSAEVGTSTGTLMPSAPENKALEIGALHRLGAPGRPVGVRVYTAFTGDPADLAGAPEKVRSWTRHGFPVELVVRYQSPDDRSDSFADTVGWLAAQLSRDPLATGLQVGNEGNVSTSPAAADGAYPGAQRAIAKAAVQAAWSARQARAAGQGNLTVGVNVAATGAPTATDARFWAGLAREGGPTLGSSLDWVGVNVYPGTWAIAHAKRGSRPTDVRAGIRAALRKLRRAAASAGLSSRTPVRITETGYPTGPRRSERAQRRVTRAIVDAVVRERRRQRIIGLSWFSLRDADSVSGNFEARYGLLRDDYSAKPAFHTLRALIGRYGTR